MVNHMDAVGSTKINKQREEEGNQQTISNNSTHLETDPPKERPTNKLKHGDEKDKAQLLNNNSNGGWRKQGTDDQDQIHKTESKTRDDQAMLYIRHDLLLKLDASCSQCITDGYGYLHCRCCWVIVLLVLLVFVFEFVLWVVVCCFICLVFGRIRGLSCCCLDVSFFFSPPASMRLIIGRQFVAN